MAAGGDAGDDSRPPDARRDEIYTWEAPHPTYALAWSVSQRGGEDLGGQSGRAHGNGSRPRTPLVPVL